MKRIIVILGSPNSPKGRLSKIAISRLHKCVEVFNPDNDLILCTGGFGKHFNTSDKPHYNLLQRSLERKGIPKKFFLPSANSSNTVEDATKTKTILSKIDFSEITIITSEYHIKRVQLIFDEILVDIEKTYLGVANNLSLKTLKKLEIHEAKAINGILTHGLYY